MSRGCPLSKRSLTIFSILIILLIGISIANHLKHGQQVLGKGIFLPLPGGQHPSKQPSLPLSISTVGDIHAHPPARSVKSRHRQLRAFLSKPHTQRKSAITLKAGIIQNILFLHQKHAPFVRQNQQLTLSQLSGRRIFFCRISSTSSAQITSRPGCNARKSRKIIEVVLKNKSWPQLSEQGRSAGKKSSDQTVKAFQ